MALVGVFLLSAGIGVSAQNSASSFHFIDYQRSIPKIRELLNRKEDTLIKQFREKFSKKYNYVPDHNGIKGYLAIYMIKATTEKMGKVDPKAFADTLHGLTIKAADEPGILMDVTFDQNGDIDRQGFLVEVVEGKQVVKQVLPKLH